MSLMEVPKDILHRHHRVLPGSWFVAPVIERSTMSSSSSSFYSYAKGRVNSTSGVGVEDPSSTYENKHKADLTCISNDIKMNKRNKYQDIQRTFVFLRAGM